MESQEDDYSNDRDEHQREDKDVPPLIIIGSCSDGHAEHEGDDPRRDGEELSLNGVEAEG